MPEEAEIVRYIYRLFIQGASTNSIATRLTEENIPTPGGKKKWQWATVESILRNEKYKGSALLQKSFTVDFLTKKTKVNEGEVPQYFVEESHPAIIEPWAWEQVQLELERRKKHRNRTRQTSCFAGKIFCGDCGEIFGSKVWHSTDKYRRVIWRCNAKFDGTEKCQTPHVTEEQIKALFLEVLGAYFSDRNQTLEQLRYAKKALTDTDFIDEDIRLLEVDLEILADSIRGCINENASNTLNEAAYHAKHKELCARFEDTENRLSALRAEREQMNADAAAIGGMMFELTELDFLPLEFDEKLWCGTVERVTVYADKRVVFRLKDNQEIVKSFNQFIR